MSTEPSPVSLRNGREAPGGLGGTPSTGPTPQSFICIMRLSLTSVLHLSPYTPVNASCSFLHAWAMQVRARAMQVRASAIQVRADLVQQYLHDPPIPEAFRGLQRAEFMRKLDCGISSAIKQ